MIAPPLWVAELAGTFWQEAGGPVPFPRALRRALLFSSFDVTVVELPGLGTGAIWEYFRRGGCPPWCAEGDRPLHGCLVALSGGAFLFLDAGDAPDEQAFSLAHELGHFLRHYWQPRRRALAALGPGVTAVLDGLRPPSPQERLHALLRQVPVGCYVHLMDRRTGGGPSEVDEAEREADLLALELLAPVEEVRARLPTDASPQEAEELLTVTFGLPRGPAAEYARVLVPVAEGSRLWARLKKPHGACRSSDAGGEHYAGGPRDEHPE